MAATRTLVLLLAAPFGPVRSRPRVLARFLERVLAGATRSLASPVRSGFLVTVLAAPVPRPGRAVGVLADFLVLALAATTSVTVFCRLVVGTSLATLLYPSPTGVLSVPVVVAPAVLLSVSGPGTVFEFGVSRGPVVASGLASLAADAGVAPADGVALAFATPLVSLFARASRRQLGPAGRAGTAAARTPGRTALFRLVAREPPGLAAPSTLGGAAGRGLCGPGDVLVPAALAASGSVAAASGLVALPGVAGQDAFYPRLVLLAAAVRPEDAALVAPPVAAVLLVAVPVGPLVV